MPSPEKKATILDPLKTLDAPLGRHRSTGRRNSKARKGSFAVRTRSQRRMNREVLQWLLALRERMAPAGPLLSAELASVMRTVFRYDLRTKVGDDEDSRQRWELRNDVHELIRRRRAVTLEFESALASQFREPGPFDIFRSLEEEELLALKERCTEPPPGGITSGDSFAAAVLRGLDRSQRGPSTPDLRRQLEAELCHMFERLDYDRRGRLRWDDLVTYMVLTPHGDQAVEVGVPMFSRPMVPLGRGVVKGAHVSCVAALNRLVLLESKGNSAQLSFLDSRNLQLIARHEMDGTTSQVLYIPPMGKYLASSLSKRMTLFSEVRDIRNDRMAWREDYTRPISLAPIILVWCDTYRAVYAGTASGVVARYSLASLNAGMVPEAQHSFHTEAVTALVPMPSIRKFAVAFVFGQVVLADAARFVPLMRLEGGSSGVHVLRLIPHANVLVTAGFSSEPLVWLTSHGEDKRSPKPIGSLVDPQRPHRGAIIAVWEDGELPPRVVSTLDAAGTAKRWDLRTLQCTYTADLHAVTSQRDSPVVHLSSAVVTQYLVAHQKVVAYGLQHSDHRAFLCEVAVLPPRIAKAQGAARFERGAVTAAAPGRSDTVASGETRKTEHLTCATINEPLQLLFTTLRDKLVGYDLRTGKIVCFLEIANEALTSCVLEPGSSRAFVGCASGRLLVVNTATGAIMGNLKPLPDEVHHIAVTARHVVAVSTNGVAATYPLRSGDGNSDTPPLVTQRVAMDGRVAATCFHDAEQTLAVGTAAGLIALFEVSDVGRLNSLGRHGVMEPGIDAAYDTIGEPPSDLIAAQNTATDRLIRDIMLGAASECTALVPLAPLPAFVAADTQSMLTVYASRQTNATGAVCCRWTATPPRALLAGATTSVPTGVAFAPAKQWLLVCDDHGCVVVWDLAVVVADVGLDYPLRGRFDEAPLRIDDFPLPVVVTSFIAAPYSPLSHLLLSPLGDSVVAAAADGFSYVMSLGGGALGTLAPDRRYEVTAPPGFLETGAEHDEKQRHLTEASRAKHFWSILRSEVLGAGSLLAAAVRTLTSVDKTRMARDIDGNPLSRKEAEAMEDSDDGGEGVIGSVGLRQGSAPVHGAECDARPVDFPPECTVPPPSPPSGAMVAPAGLFVSSRRRTVATQRPTSASLSPTRSSRRRSARLQLPATDRLLRDVVERLHELRGAQYDEAVRREEERGTHSELPALSDAIPIMLSSAAVPPRRLFPPTATTLLGIHAVAAALALDPPSLPWQRTTVAGFRRGLRLTGHGPVHHPRPDDASTRPTSQTPSVQAAPSPPDQQAADPPTSERPPSTVSLHRRRMRQFDAAPDAGRGTSGARTSASPEVEVPRERPVPLPAVQPTFVPLSTIINGTAEWPLVACPLLEPRSRRGLGRGLSLGSAPPSAECQVAEPARVIPDQTHEPEAEAGDAVNDDRDAHSCAPDAEKPAPGPLDFATPPRGVEASVRAERARHAFAHSIASKQQAVDAQFDSASRVLLRLSTQRSVSRDVSLLRGEQPVGGGDAADLLSAAVSSYQGAPMARGQLLRQEGGGVVPSVAVPRAQGLSNGALGGLRRGFTRRPGSAQPTGGVPEMVVNGQRSSVGSRVAHVKEASFVPSPALQLSTSHKAPTWAHVRR